MARDPSVDGRSERGVSGDEIFALLRAAEDEGASVADLCAASGVTVPTYCVWKTRYRGLSLTELRAARDREVRRARVTAAALAAALVVCAAGATLLVAYPAPRQAAASARPTPEDPATTAPPPEISPLAAEPSSRSEAATEAGYFVQVAAMPDEPMARRLVARLAIDGHRAVVVPSTVNGVRVFRVRLGPYDAKAQADALVSTLERQGSSGSWVTR